MTKRIFDLRISQADDPEADQQIVGGWETISEYVKGIDCFLNAQFNDSRPIDDAMDHLEMRWTIGLTQFTLKNCN